MLSDFQFVSSVTLIALVSCTTSCCNGLDAKCIVTTEDGTSQHAACDAPIKLAIPHTPDPNATWQLFVSDNITLQTMVGFGAAWTDATVTVFDSLPAAKHDELMHLLFQPQQESSHEHDDGIGLTLMRHTIGQSDLTPASIGEWSYDDTPNGAPDPTLSHFNLTKTGTRMVAWLKHMYSVNDNITLLGSVWSPPQWMKSGTTLDMGHADAWVAYFIKYLEAFRTAGVHVNAVTLQNEPLHSADPAWTMYMNASMQAVLVNKLKPKIAAAGLNTKIWAYDHNTDQPDYPQYVLDNTDLDTVAWHCYASGPPANVWAPLTAFAKKNPGVTQVMTECWTHVGSGESFFDLPTFVGMPLQNGAAGAMAWTLGGSTNYDVAYPGGCQPCSGIVQVDMKNGTFIKTQDYYTLGHYSKFVPPGAKYYATSGNYDYADGTGVQSNAFLVDASGASADGRRVVVIHNKIRNHLRIQVNFEDDSWIGNVPARSVVTWVI
eukprot:m.356315 g.356315  ORF g.356315 m.356315 type:complete len:489 (+) comp20749_c0_seq12:126-1592(+)